MNASELRIGDWVARQTIDAWKDIFELRQCTSNDIQACTISPKKFQPVPLTEEWLEKFGLLLGFDHKYTSYEIEYMFDKWHLRVTYDVGMSKYITTIEYVHQLQNIYHSITGEELEIN